MGYANPIERRASMRSPPKRRPPASTACSWSTIRPRKPGVFAEKMRAAQIDPIFLLAPTSTDERIADVGKIASGYVYYVSLKA
nr:tryptophan synthase subunit alpha [Burkholderia ambifaria]